LSSRFIRGPATLDSYEQPTQPRSKPANADVQDLVRTWLRHQQSAIVEIETPALKATGSHACDFSVLLANNTLSGFPARRL